uniref:Sarcospan n=1 Tax=Felis catus TaxID=9685 RepID=A0ABI7Y038_FELCA
MGKDKQPRGQRRQGGPAADAAGPDDMGPKTGKRAPKECGEEEARTCCGCRFPLLLALLQLALGIAVTVLGFLMASISSSLLVRDTPFWAGIIRETEHERGRGRERGRHRIGNRLQARSHQPRA